MATSSVISRCMAAEGFRVAGFSGVTITITPEVLEYVF